MKKKKIIIEAVILCLVIIGGGIYAMQQPKELVLYIHKKSQVIEYGQTYTPTFKDLVITKNLDKDDIKELKKNTQIKSNIKNEDNKEYPAIGQYKVTVQYHKQKKTKVVEVKDTTAPQFNDTNEVTIPFNQENYDFNKNISATDLSPVTIEYQKENIDFKQAGTYTLKAIATDQSGNKSEKDIQIKVESEKVETPKVQGQTTYVKNGNNKVICIDAGHQARGNNEKEPNGPGSSIYKAKVTTGATGVATHSLESQINLQVALKLQRILQQNGYQVIMCRTSQDVNISNAQRAQIANNAHAAAFVRLHCDSSASSAPTGTMTMAPSQNNAYCSAISLESQKLARAILNQTCKAAGSHSRGVSITDTMTGLNWAQVPVTIIEMGFLSNPTEDQLLSSDSYQEKLAQGIASGISEYLNQ